MRAGLALTFRSAGGEVAIAFKSVIPLNSSSISGAIDIGIAREEKKHA
jgi:hypothetical protein